MPTKLTGLAFSEKGPSVSRAIYCPQLTQEQVIAMPEGPGLVGAIVFDVDTEELETYTAAGFWLPILTTGSDINTENINATNADLTHIHSHDITNDAVITTLGLLTTNDAQINGNLHVETNLLVDGTANLTSGTVSGNLAVNGTLNSTSIINNDVITTLGLHATSNVQIDGNMLCATGGVTGDLGVNGYLTAGNIATTGTLQVDGDSTLQNVTIQGDLTVTGFTITDQLNATDINALDIGATSIQAEQLLYGLTNLGGGSPVIVNLDVGAGTGATATATGSMTGFKLNIQTGTSPVVGVIATFQFPSGLSPLVTGIPSVITTPGSVTTAQYETTSRTYVTTASGTTFALHGSSLVALAASTTYIWNFIVVGNQLGT